VTIDGETARDFDDAIAVAALPRGGFRLFVHIADVAHFVPPGGALDLEARRRGTSVYFPDRVVPMFPERLSNDLCSLRAERDRLVQTVILDFTARGVRRAVRFADGIIRSRARLTYTGVAALLAGDRAAVPDAVAPMLRAADRLRAALEQRRIARGSIDFDLPEPQILLDVEGAMTGITVEPRNRAHRMIEEFMIAANEAVAEHLEGAGGPALYRIHERPDPDKLEALAAFARAFGLELAGATGPGISPRDVQELIASVADRPECRVVSQVALRAMKQARYSGGNCGHFGLASSAYAHFTSPIRRYPDLVLHRLLRARRQGVAAASVLGGVELESLATACSELERSAEAAERELLLWKKVAFIERQVGAIFEGIVTGVARFGLFVQLIDSLVEGLVHVERLGSEWFEFVESRQELRGVVTGRTYRLGDRLAVRVDRVDRVLRRVDLAPVEPQAAAPARGRKKPRRRPAGGTGARRGARGRRRRR
jgi:ribonuclease R